MAIRELDLRRGEAGRFFVTSLDYCEVLEVEGALPDHAWCRAAARSEELYIVHGEWLWSFVLTHEEWMGIGPYFVYALADGEARVGAGAEPNLRQRK